MPYSPKGGIGLITIKVLYKVRVSGSVSQSVSQSVRVSQSIPSLPSGRENSTLNIALYQFIIIMKQYLCFSQKGMSNKNSTTTVRSGYLQCMTAAFQGIFLLKAPKWNKTNFLTFPLRENNNNNKNSQQLITRLNLVTD